jgi:hypothetical protein
MRFVLRSISKETGTRSTGPWQRPSMLSVFFLSILSTKQRQAAAIPATPNGSQSNSHDQPQQSKHPSTSTSLDCPTPPQTEPDLLYLQILDDAVKETPESGRQHPTPSNPYVPRSEAGLTPRNCLRTRPPQLDDVDYEYIVKKRVFDLPPPSFLYFKPFVRPPFSLESLTKSTEMS